jgi:hypothetical protein
MVSGKKVQLVNLFHVLRYDEQFTGVRNIIKSPSLFKEYWKRPEV